MSTAYERGILPAPCAMASARRDADIPCGALHRNRNTGMADVVFIEVQTGTYFGEDDIERFEGDYGRV